MLTGKHVSVGLIINNLYRDKGYKYELPYSDAIEWAVDAIRLIGAPMAFTQKQVSIKLEDSRAKLPQDLQEIIQVAGSFGGCYPFSMTSESSSFIPQKIEGNLQLTQDFLSGVPIDLSLLEPIGQDINGNPVYPIQQNNIAFPISIANPTPQFANYGSYVANDNYIFPNFSEGYIFLSYRGLPVDCAGLPTIPDNQRYIEAVKAFIGWKLDYLLWRRGELTERIYRDSEAEWLWYVGSAGNAARMPNIDGMQSLLNEIKLLGNKYSYNRFFTNLGKL